MTNEQLDELQNIRNAVDDLYGRLDIDLYEKTNAAKVTGRSTNLEKTIGSNFNLLVFAAIAAIALLAFKGIQVQ